MDLWSALRGTRRGSKSFPVTASARTVPGARYGARGRLLYWILVEDAQIFKRHASLHLL
jgi:hypothetical protein